MDLELTNIVVTSYESRVVIPPGGYINSSPPLPDYRTYIDSSDIELDAGSIDLIARNADFIEF